MISQYGAANIEKNGETIGIQFEFELPDLPNASIALFEKVQVYIDGELFEGKNIKISTDRWNFFGLDEILDFLEVRWGYGKRAVIRVLKDGGVTSGCHEIKCLLTYRGEMQPRYDSIGCRKLTFV